MRGLWCPDHARSSGSHMPDVDGVECEKRVRQFMAVQFEPDGSCIVVFIDTDEVRCEGAVALQQSVRIEPTDDYADGIDAVQSAVRLLVKDALGAWKDSEPYRPEDAVDAASERTLEDEEDLVAARNWRAIEESRMAPRGDAGTSDRQP